MAHEIDTMMFSGETPWHGLGVFVGDKNLTAEEAIQKAGLNWRVETRVAKFIGNDGKPKDGDGFQIVRTDRDTSLGHCGDIYTPLQNKEAFQFMDEVIGMGRAVYHTAGSLAGGRKVWLLVDMKESAEIGKGDEIRNFALLSNGHDGRTVLDFCLTNIRVVCANTLNMALTKREKGLFYSFRHTKTIHEKSKNVKEALATVSAKFAKFVEAGKILSAKNISRKELDDFLIRLEVQRANEREGEVSEETAEKFMRTAKYSELVKAFETSPGSGLPGANGTYWGALNAVSYYYDHEATSRETEVFPDRKEARLNSAWFNGGQNKKSLAFDLALALAKQ